MSDEERMTSAEYRVILARLGLHAESAACIPGIDRRSSFRWYRNRDYVDPAVARVLRSLMRAGVTPESLDEALRVIEGE